MMAAIEPSNPARATSAPSGFSSACLPSRPAIRLSLGVYMPGIMTCPGPLDPGYRSSSQCFAFHRRHHFMPFSLLKNCLRRNSQRISKGEGAQHHLRPTHSMHRHAGHLLGRLHRLYVTLDTKPVEYRHDGFFAGALKRIPGNFSGLRQLLAHQLRGAIQLVHSSLLGASVRLVGSVCHSYFPKHSVQKILPVSMDQ